MANFDTGIKRFIKCVATVEVNFPVDFKDNPDISCMQCQFFSRNTGMCQLTKDIVSFPNKYVGNNCPLIKIDE